MDEMRFKGEVSPQTTIKQMDSSKTNLSMGYCKEVLPTSAPVSDISLSFPCCRHQLSFGHAGHRLRALNQWETKPRAQTKEKISAELSLEPAVNGIRWYKHNSDDECKQRLSICQSAEIQLQKKKIIIFIGTQQSHYSNGAMRWGKANGERCEPGGWA